MDLAGRRVVVVGMGLSGRAAARLALARGAQVVGVDRSEAVAPLPGVRLELGPHRAQTFLGADLLVLSPGVPPQIPEVWAAREAGVQIAGELGLAAAFLDLPVAAITGTNGKSTVTSFTGQLLQAAGMRPFVGGNLGRPACEAALDEAAGAFDCAVLEVSSYQLELPGPLRPRVGVVLNLAPDHLTRHGDLETYGATKCRLFARMGPSDLAVLPAGDPLLARLAEGVGEGSRAWLGDLPGVVRDGRLVGLRIPGHSGSFDLGGFAVPGEHNLDNAATAILLAVAMGASSEAVQAAIPALRALPHRMEVVAEAGGVTWINDSKATNVAAAQVGIAGLGRKAVVLLGGEAKGESLEPLVGPLRAQRAVLTFGGSGPELAAALQSAGLDCVRCGDLAEAVARAAELACPGDAVLLSPACASFDAFRNFEHRGEVFAQLARAAARRGSA